MRTLSVHPNGPIFKKGDDIICIENVGATYQLTIGKTYKVIKFERKYNANIVVFMGDATLTDSFSSRFTTIKLERERKLKKLKAIYEKS